jgi:tetratricopeptide (TPR) repeat protein
VIDQLRWLRLLAIAALLAAFISSAPGGVRNADGVSQFDASCESMPPRDRAGLEHCLALSPRDIEVMLDLGTVYEAEGAAGRAEALYRLALTIDARDADVHVRLGRLLLGRGDLAGAAHAATIALDLQPGSSRALDLVRRAGHGDGR